MTFFIQNTDTIIFIMELIGTVAFASSGAMIAFRKNMDIFGVNVLAIITAVGGGVLRDVLATQKPYILVKHVYACASLLGALVCVLSWTLGSIPAMWLGAATVLAIRIPAMIFRWNLPRIQMEES